MLQTTSISDFTFTNNTYITSVTVLSEGTTADTAEACIQGCADDSDCIYWSWCPADQTSGCTVPGLNGASDTTVPAKGCVLSYDSDASRNAVFVMSGESVTFAGGKWNPSNYVPSPPAAPGTPPAPAADPNNPAAWIDPSGTPAECNGWFSGDQWSGDEIECHVCDSEYQLKCDLDTDLIGDDSVKCEFDRAGLAALINNAIEFDCVVDFKKTPQNQCDWAGIAAKLPTCAVEPVRRILATWSPKE
ncbi:hypothetical protein ABPG77_003005 [Micractinium sp. CCAP 211/92]